MNNLDDDVKANPRDFYRYINSQKKDTQCIPLKKRQGSGVAQSEFEKADEFNGQFRDVLDVFKTEHNGNRPFRTQVIISYPLFPKRWPLSNRN